MSDAPPASPSSCAVNAASVTGSSFSDPLRHSRAACSSPAARYSPASAFHSPAVVSSGGSPFSDRFRTVFARFEAGGLNSVEISEECSARASSATMPWAMSPPPMYAILDTSPASNNAPGSEAACSSAHLARV